MFTAYGGVPRGGRSARPAQLFQARHEQSDWTCTIDARHRLRHGARLKRAFAS